MTAPVRPLRGPPAAPAPASAAQRKAALLLHALEERDRDWLLARLPEAQRAHLSTLLEELRDLGIRADRTIVDEALARDEATPAPAGPTAVPERTAGASGPLASLTGRELDRLARLLRGQPARLTVHLLRAGEWAWHAGLLRRLPAALRRCVEAELRDVDVPAPALRAELVALVARDLGLDARAPGQSVPAGRWARLLRRGGRR
jgi:hypothetical protein